MLISDVSPHLQCSTFFFIGSFKRIGFGFESNFIGSGSLRIFQLFGLMFFGHCIGAFSVLLRIVPEYVDVNKHICIGTGRRNNVHAAQENTVCTGGKERVARYRHVSFRYPHPANICPHCFYLPPSDFVRERRGIGRRCDEVVNLSNRSRCSAVVSTRIA